MKWDEPMRRALELAAAAPHDGDVPVGAVVLGDGIAAFPRGAEPQLQRTGVRELEGSSNVLITYAVV